MGTVWAPPEEGTQGIINISALTWMRLTCCRLHPSECTKLLTSSTASGCARWVRGEGRWGCAVHSAPWDDVSFFSHYISFFHRMGAHVCVCLFLCGIRCAHQVFPGGIRRKYQSSPHYVTVSPNQPPLLYQVQGHHQSAKEMCPVQSSCTGILAHSSKTLLKLCILRSLTQEMPRYVGPSLLSPMHKLKHT